MQGMNFDKIGEDLAQAYEDGYKKGLEENKINNKKLKALQEAVDYLYKQVDYLYEDIYYLYKV